MEFSSSDEDELPSPLPRRDAATPPRDALGGGGMLDFSSGDDSDDDLPPPPQPLPQPQPQPQPQRRLRRRRYAQPTAVPTKAEALCMAAGLTGTPSASALCAFLGARSLEQVAHASATLAGRGGMRCWAVAAFAPRDSALDAHAPRGVTLTTATLVDAEPRAGAGAPAEVAVKALQRNWSSVYGIETEQRDGHWLLTRGHGGAASRGGRLLVALRLDTHQHKRSRTLCMKTVRAAVNSLGAAGAVFVTRRTLEKAELADEIAQTLLRIASRIPALWPPGSPMRVQPDIGAKRRSLGDVAEEDADEDDEEDEAVTRRAEHRDRLAALLAADINRLSLEPTVHKARERCAETKSALIHTPKVKDTGGALDYDDGAQLSLAESPESPSRPSWLDDGPVQWDDEGGGSGGGASQSRHSQGGSSQGKRPAEPAEVMQQPRLREADAVLFLDSKDDVGTSFIAAEFFEYE